jgi:hypothetical protein
MEAIVDTDVGTLGEDATQEGESGQFSADWWHNRTPEELRDIINRGFAVGDLFPAATAELARRAEEARRAAEREAAALSDLERRKTWKRRVLFLLASLSLIATFFTLAVIAMHIGAD